MLKNLKFGLKISSGRNNSGRISSFHRGGGHKQKFTISKENSKLINLYNLKFIKLIYNPINNVKLALLTSTQGNLFFLRSNILLEKEKYNYFSSEILNDFLHFKLKGNLINNIGLANNSSIYIKSAGVSGIILGSFLNKYTIVKLPSGKLKLFSFNFKCAEGQISNENFYFKKLKKAGNSRWLNKRPIVRGVAMNPVDHPHGGGGGKTSGGRHSVSPWGFITKSNYKTRRNKKNTNIYK